MGCIYNSFEGECQLYEEGHPANPNGCDESGICICDDDPDPNDTCESYESDYTCHDCGADFNLDEECQCE